MEDDAGTSVVEATLSGDFGDASEVHFLLLLGLITGSGRRRYRVASGHFTFSSRMNVFRWAALYV
jgi:hypothetical protein